MPLNSPCLEVRVTGSSGSEFASHKPNSGNEELRFVRLRDFLDPLKTPLDPAYSHVRNEFSLFHLEPVLHDRALHFVEEKLEPLAFHKAQGQHPGVFRTRKQAKAVKS